MPKRRVHSRPAGVIEQRRNISERVARREKRDPVDMRPLMQELLSERRENMQEFLSERRAKRHSAGTSTAVPAVFVKCVPWTQ